MELHNDFEVAAPLDAVWAYMLDVEKIAPCMPGAELTEVVDDHNWKGKVTVKVGPVSMAFIGAVVMVERDDTAKRVVLKADGRDSRGKGSASANVTARMEATDAGTKVSIDTDLTITGAAAQYARGGMIEDISGRLTKEFASCLQANIGAAAHDAPAGQPAAAVAARPVKGIRLALWAFWRSVVRFFKGLGGGKSSA
jgi:uncharacterized protein